MTLTVICDECLEVVDEDVDTATLDLCIRCNEAVPRRSPRRRSKPRPSRAKYQWVEDVDFKVQVINQLTSIYMCQYCPEMRDDRIVMLRHLSGAHRTR